MTTRTETDSLGSIEIDNARWVRPAEMPRPNAEPTAR